jgi:hypothetical protein
MLSVIIPRLYARLSTLIDTPFTMLPTPLTTRLNFAAKLLIVIYNESNLLYIDGLFSSCPNVPSPSFIFFEISSIWSVSFPALKDTLFRLSIIVSIAMGSTVSILYPFEIGCDSIEPAEIWTTLLPTSPSVIIEALESVLIYGTAEFMISSVSSIFPSGIILIPVTVPISIPLNVTLLPSIRPVTLLKVAFAVIVLENIFFLPPIIKITIVKRTNAAITKNPRSALFDFLLFAISCKSKKGFYKIVI